MSSRWISTSLSLPSTPFSRLIEACAAFTSEDFPMPRAPQSSALLAGSPRAKRSVFSTSRSRTRSIPLRRFRSTRLMRFTGASAPRSARQMNASAASKSGANGGAGASRSSASAMRLRRSAWLWSGGMRRTPCNAPRFATSRGQAPAPPACQHLICPLLLVLFCLVGLWATRWRCPHFHRLRRRAELGGAFFIGGLLRRPVLVVAADASGAVKDGVRSVGIDVDLDPRLDEVRAHRAFRYLQLQRAVGDAIVMADLPLLLDAQDLVEVNAGNGREGRAFAGRIDGETRVVGRQVDLADEGVRRFDIGYAGERELLDQPILKRRERALRAPARLRRIGPDVLDPELFERPPDLGQMGAVDLAAGLGGVKVVRPAVGVEAHRQAVLAEHLLQRPKGRGRALLLDQERRGDRARRIVHRHDQVERRLAFEPGVPRTVLVQHHPWQRPPLALAPVRPLARRLRHHARPLKMKLRPGVTPAEAMVLHQMLMEVLDREALVALAIKPLHLLRPVRRDPFARRLAEPAVDKPVLAFLLVAARPSPERPLAHAQKLRRLFLVQLRRFPAAENVQKHRHAHPLKGLRPAHPNPSKKGRTYRTDRALPKPDISCASDTEANNLLLKIGKYGSLIIPLIVASRRSSPQRAERFRQ